MQITIPHLEKTSNSKQLIVNGKPFLMLAGELQNSSMTSAKYMEEAWPKLTAANINTVLGCVTWEQIEPGEGSFNFDELDKVVEGARRHGLRLVLLWFGSFKNGMCFLHVNETMASGSADDCRSLNIRSSLGEEGHETLSQSKA